MGYAHRIAWEVANGQSVPAGMTIDHLCHTGACDGGEECEHRRCVNPAHLVVAERLANYLRTARKERCRNGHIEPARDADGECLLCKAAGVRRRAAASRAGRPATLSGRPPHPQREPALELLREGVPQAEVCRRLSVASQTVSRWASGRSDRPNVARVPAPVRAQARERDGERCVRCGATSDGAGRMSLHHRRPRGRGSDLAGESHDLSNLVLLCGSGTTGCHGWVESNRAAAYAAGWLVRHGVAVTSDVPIRWHGQLVLLDNEGGYTPCTSGSTPGQPGSPG